MAKLNFLVTLIVALLTSNAFADSSPPLRSENYLIQKGDNLSSISKTLFGDSNYWPRVWAAQPKQSHLVDASHAIHFLLGSEEAAPSFSIAEADDQVELKENSGLIPAAATSHFGTPVEIPPPQVRPRPVLQILPESLPEWQKIRRTKSKFLDYDVEIVPRRQMNFEERQTIPIYVQDDRLESVGKLLSTVSEMALVTPGEEIFVRLKSGSGHEGAHYLLVQDGGQLQSNPLAGQNRLHEAYVVQILAEIVLLTPAQAKPAADWDVYRAKVVQAAGVSVKNSDIIAGRMNTVSLSKVGPMAPVKAEIIGGNYDSRGIYFGEGSWVFLDRGARDGLRAGQLMWADTNPIARDPNSTISVGINQAALIKIAFTSEGVATGIVISSKEAITQGDSSVASASGSAIEDEAGSDTGADIDNSDLEDPPAE
jgi:hypothetical protein